MALAPHQERVVEEREDLALRLRRLRSFMAGPMWLALPAAERDRLTRQAGLMGGLVDVLGERIAAFGPAA